MSAIATAGLDPAEEVVQAHGADATGRALFRKKLRRDRALARPKKGRGRNAIDKSQTPTAKPLI